MQRTVLWGALAAAFVLTMAGGAVAARGPSGPHSSGHAPPKSSIKHPPLPVAVVRELTRKRSKARNTASGTQQGASRPQAPRAVRSNVQLLTRATDLASALETSSITPNGPATYVTQPTNGTPDLAVSPDSPPPGFPTDGGSFAIMTTGDATEALLPNDPNNVGTDDGPDPASKGSNRQNAHDVTILKIPITVPKNGGNCLSFDYRFLTDEYPQYTRSPYNDMFVAELDKNTWTATGTNAASPVSAPNDFATDTSGKPVSVNAAASAQISSGYAADTFYNAATPLMRASTPVTPGPHVLYLSIFDQYDHSIDSAAFVDGLSLATTAAGQCNAGSVVDEQPADLSVATIYDATTGDISVTVTNDGPADAQNVVVTSQLFGMQFTSGEGAPDCGSPDNVSVTCTVGTLAAGALESFKILTSANPGNSSFFTDTKVISSTYDPVLGNNESYEEDDETPPPTTQIATDLGVGVGQIADTPQGTTVTIPVTIKNNGPNDYTGAIGLDTYVPTQLNFIGWQAPDGESIPAAFDGCFAVVDGEISCSFEEGYSLPANGTFEVDLLAYVVRTGWIQPQSYLFSEAADPNQSNNVAFGTFHASPTTFQTSNISVTEMPSVDFAPDLGTITYTDTVTNAGPAEATSVAVSDERPGGTTAVSVADTLGGCRLLDTGGFDCSIDLKAGKTDTITYKVTVNSGLSDGTYILDYVTAEPAGYYDPNIDDNYWYGFTLVAAAPPEPADLMSKITSPTTATAGTPITTTASITNKGPSTVQDAVLQLDSYMLNNGYMVSDPGCAFDQYGDLNCDAGQLAKGASKTFKVVWTPEFAGQDTIVAFAESPDLTWEDPSFANNGASVPFSVSQPLDNLAIGITDAIDPIASGANETYTITVSNALFYDPAANVQVVDALPAGESFVSASGKNWTCTPAAIVTCSLKGTLASGASSTITLVVKVQTGNATITDGASVVSSTPDADPTDNSASVLTALAIT